MIRSQFNHNSFIRRYCKDPQPLMTLLISEEYIRGKVTEIRPASAGALGEFPFQNQNSSPEQFSLSCPRTPTKIRRFQEPSLIETRTGKSSHFAVDFFFYRSFFPWPHFHSRLKHPAVHVVVCLNEECVCRMLQLWQD